MLATTRRPFINSTTVGPPKYPRKNLHPWLPYAILGSCLITLIIIGLCCFLKSFRSCCCHLLCCNCCRSSKPDNSGEGRESVVSRSGSKSRSNSGEKVHITPPAIPPSTQPSRYHMQAAAKTQKYIGNLLATRRGSYQAQNAYTAPPAAKQVARTAKIIGNILAPDANKRRRT